MPIVVKDYDTSIPRGSNASRERHSDSDRDRDRQRQLKQPRLD